MEGEGECNFHKHGGAKRRVNIHIGIDEKTWKSGLRSSPSATLWTRPMLPELLDQITPEQKIAPPPSPPPPTAPLTPASAMMPSPRAVPRRASRPAITQSRGSPTPPVRSPATRSCAHQSVWAHHLATMEQISLPKPRRDQDALCETAQPAPQRTRLTVRFHLRAAVLNGFTALATLITEVTV